MITMYAIADDTVLRAHLADVADVDFITRNDDDDMITVTYAVVTVAEFNLYATCDDCAANVRDVADRAVYYADAATTATFCLDCFDID